MHFLSVDGPGDGKPFRISKEVSPGDLATIDQQRAEGEEILHALTNHTIAHVTLMHLYPEDEVAIRGNAGHLAGYILSLDRARAIAVINLAIEVICNQEIADLGGYEAAAQAINLDNLREIFRQAEEDRRRVYGDDDD